MIGIYCLAITFGIVSTDSPSRARCEPGDGSGVAIPSDPVFQALLTNGSTVSGQIRRLGEKDGVTLVSETAEERTIPLTSLVKLTREGVLPQTSAESGDIVLFPDGDRIAHCKVDQAGEFNLAVRSSTFENLSIPLDALLGLVFDAKSDSAATDSLVARVRSESRDAELLWLSNGDKLPGIFSGLDDKKLTFQPETGKVELPRQGLQALGFPQGQVVYRRPDGPYFELKLGDRSRLGMSRIKLERGQLVGTTRFKSEIRFPIGELAQLHVMNSSVVYLSDRETSGTIYEPYVGPTRPYRRNSTVAGDVLRLGGRSYDRGLGTQSRSVLVYKLEPGSKRFQALVGVDDRAGPLGNVVFKVQGDKKTLFESSPMVAGEATKIVDLDLSGMTFLILMTEFGERGDVQDHADWVEARIIR